MRKVICLLLSAIIFSCLLAGCVNKTVPNKAIPDVAVRAYMYNESDEPVKPTVLLQENNKFLFTYSMLSNYIAYGSYQIDGNNLILETDDKNCEYVFEIKNDTLIFNAEKSSAIPSFANVPNRAIFK